MKKTSICEFDIRNAIGFPSLSKVFTSFYLRAPLYYGFAIIHVLDQSGRDYNRARKFL